MTDSCLRVDRLTKRYGDVLAVDALSFEVKRGEIFGFLGPNGAGKTTSLTMICGLVRPDSGQVFVLGANSAAPNATLRAQVGVCPQQVVVWPRLTCIEQLEFMGETYGLSRAEAQRRGKNLLATLGLATKANSLARSLSGGMQRRLSIALALVHDPEIVVLDEPEAGLDPQSRVLVREYIADLVRSRGKTVIFTTHNMDEAERIVDRVAIIDHGRLLELDTPHELKRRIGKGDTLEIELSERGGVLSEVTQCNLNKLFPDAELTENRLVLRQLAILERLPSVVEQLKTVGVTMSGIQLRESSLEDVFIALTGRSLRG
jgi:ABC-2 type transport system ATP-binding protein